MHGVTSAGEKGNLFGSGSAWRVLGDTRGSCTVSAGGSTGGIGVHYFGTSRLSTDLGNSVLEWYQVLSARYWCG